MLEPEIRLIAAAAVSRMRRRAIELTGQQRDDATSIIEAAITEAINIDRADRRRANSRYLSAEPITAKEAGRFIELGKQRGWKSR